MKGIGIVNVVVETVSAIRGKLYVAGGEIGIDISGQENGNKG